jgi:hypothetical protein
MKFLRQQSILRELSPKRALVIYGPRRVGKTTMLLSYLKDVAVQHPEWRTHYTTGDDLDVREVFSSERRTRILNYVKPYDVIAIDEAQVIPKIGLAVKMIVDAFPEKIVILTGSSSLDLSKQVGEPLTGRHFTMTVWPLAQMEMEASRFELTSGLAEQLIYGSYPEVLLEDDRLKKQRILNELVSSYLFKDVLALDRIKSPKILLDIVRCLAFQVGSEVSINEIGRTVGADAKTVARYIDLMEKMFIIVRVGGFHRNLRNEIAKRSKYYFLDNGIRNAVIGQYNDLPQRNDIGALWENFIVIELMKRRSLLGTNETLYFWRTSTGQEIDIISESNGVVTAIECKWSPQNVTVPSAWRKAYPQASFSVIHRENYLDALLDD